MKTTTLLRMLLSLIAVAAIGTSMMGQRRVTPIENAQTTTQAVNEFRGDTARINAERRARMIEHYHDSKGRVVYIDTITGEEWVDTTQVAKKPAVKYPKLWAVTVGVDIWDPVMRAFGQDYGLIGFWGELSLWNRINPVFEFGLGQAKRTPGGLNYTYTSPMAPYFKLGANYNFMFRSKPQYQFLAGVRYGFSNFKFSVEGTYDDSYWGETLPVTIPEQTITAGWLELQGGLRVQLWRQVSAGWMFRYRHVLHQSRAQYGDPDYIPGFGTRTSSISGSFSISYIFELGKYVVPDDTGK